MRAKFVNESINKTINAWHVSPNPVRNFTNDPAWFTPSEELATAYYNNIKEDYGRAHVYEVIISGNILSLEEIESLSEKFDIDFYDLSADLTANPSLEEIHELVSPFRDKCDGFIVSDYDPRNPQRDVESILVFNPEKNVKIIE